MFEYAQQYMTTASSHRNSDSSVHANTSGQNQIATINRIHNDYTF
jgi:hypothetical protein